MRLLIFYVLYIIARLVFFLPLKVLYVISDICCFFVYRVIRYRLETVRTNLRNAFPEKSESELRQIEERFYKHFCDLFLEVNFVLFVSKRRAQKMVSFKNIELLNEFYDRGKSIVAVGAHYCNWEILSIIALYDKHLTIGAYKPLKNKHFENFINKSRQKFGGFPVPMHDVARMALKMSQEGKPFFLGLISDQTPAKGDIRYWTTFLNQDTPVFLGTEKIAKKTNQPVMFCNMRKLSRGRYEVDFVVLTENPKDTKSYEITEMHVQELEKLIREAPEYWLWSHRRWKHKKVNFNQPVNNEI